MGYLLQDFVMIDSFKTAQVLNGKFPMLELPAGQQVTGDEPVTFAELLTRSVGRVDELAKESESLAVDLAVGKPVELHQVMIASAKAQIAMELFIEIRNKLIEAYQQVSQMPV